MGKIVGKFVFNFAWMPTAGKRVATTAHVQLSISVTVETRLSDLGNNSLWNHEARTQSNPRTVWQCLLFHLFDHKLLIIIVPMRLL